MTESPLALLTVAQMGEADRRTIADGGSGAALMEAAGGAVARAIMRRWAPCPVVVLCGPGNNGGDGFVVARKLAEAGWAVRLALLGDPEKLAGDARYHATLWHGPVEAMTESALDGAALIVDALFGTGLGRRIGAPADGVLRAAAARGVPIVAVDVPSGVAGDTGADLGAVRATLTVTFFRKKPAHLLLPGRYLCGDVEVADIGIGAEVLPGLGITTHENGPALWLGDLPRAMSGGNKYGRGHALIYGGGVMTGAARMAARAAARAGAGLTTVAVPERAWAVYAGALTSIMVMPLPAPETLAPMLQDRRITAMLIGPGAGAGEQTRAHSLAMLGTGRAVLLDADALTAFQHCREDVFRAITGPCVMTPHEGEFRRLFADDGDKLFRARAAAKLSGAVIVLKGADTVVAAPDGRAVINGNAPDTLATAGSGDVLAGIILGLLAQGMDGFSASCAGIWMHGAAAQAFGPGLIAEDLPDLLPGVLQALHPDPHATPPGPRSWRART
jgi:NAD(P)H-hydrate epimerase